MSHLPAGALPVTGAGLFIAGSTIGVGWVAAAGAGTVVAGFVIFRYGHRIAGALRGRRP